MQDRFTSLQLLASCFAVSSLASIAQLIRQDKPVSISKFVGTLLYGGVVGLIVGALLYKYLGDDNYILLIGISALAGLGGTSVLDLLMAYWAGGGIQIVVRPANDADPDEE